MSVPTAPMSATSISISVPWRTSAPARTNSTGSARWRGSVFSVEAAMARTGVPPSCGKPSSRIRGAGQFGVDGRGLGGILLRP